MLTGNLDARGGGGSSGRSSSSSGFSSGRSGGSSSSKSWGSSSSGASKSWGSSSSGGSKSWGSSSSGTSKSSSGTSSGSGSFFSWGSSASKPADSTNVSKTWGNSTTSNPPSVGVTSDNNSRSSAKFSSTDAALNSKVAAAPPTESRAKMVDKFVTSKANQEKYQNNFKTEPTTRPAYIPQGYVDTYGAYRYIYYNPMYVGYGYWDMYGHWIMFNALQNAAYANVNAGWTPGYQYGAGSFILAFILIVGFVIVIAIVRS